ncbi:hypothetical protein NADFUDRAFT_42974 [Nadsonia fulvescens var. elongata DSM 6958]|uniref:Mediator of RNA polymerase II transcription subunit 8 n=1 Tax=Nadsonia fulvescens var. elongata DSM 6958 TaxID=857566 RepID=A0A1E3PH87_9ASCO|nr:hypothetical protein NADFUDRAFT_42974 [Nadsonia fulvescens var. elongata DSM 6958]
MESPDISAVPVEALEQLRLRLTQVTHSLGKLQAQLHQPSLPSWPSLQSQFIILLTQLISLSQTLSLHSDILQQTVAYPLPNFPSRTEEGLLTTLLRKKPLPEVEKWVNNGHELAQGIKVKDVEDFCSWAAEVVRDIRDNHMWFGFSTQRELDDGAVAEEYTLKAAEEDDGGIPVDKVLQFMYQGREPSAQQVIPPRPFNAMRN